MRIRGFLLRLLGVQPWEETALLDDRRHSIVVTHHAIGQATIRYGNNDPLQILVDVACALREGRIGTTTPHGYTGRGDSIRCVWTSDNARAYVVRKARGNWIVLTALPARDLSRSQQRRDHRKRYTPPDARILRGASHRLHLHGTPAVGAALERAGIHTIEETA